MQSQPHSPSVFQTIYLPPPHLDPCPTHPQAQFIFSHKLETIQQFITMIEDNPQNIQEITQLQLKWQKRFFKSELKAALYLNYSLIKLHTQQTQQIKRLNEQIQVKTAQKRKIGGQGQFSNDNIENSHDHSNNAIGTSKKRTFRQAYEAQKKLIQAKHHRQYDDLKKLFEHRELVLRASKQQNEYLRSQLIKMSQKNVLLQKLNKDAQMNKRKYEEDQKRMNMVIRQLEESEKKLKHEKKLSQITCSPILRSNDNLTIEEGQISFNHDFVGQNNTEAKILKQKLEQAGAEIQILKEQIKSVNKSDEIDIKHDQVMKQSRRLFLVTLRDQYEEIRRQLQEKVLQVQKYKRDIQDQQMLKNNSSSQSKLLPQSALQKCSKCQILIAEKSKLSEELNKIESKYDLLRKKFDKTLNLEYIQRKQWVEFLSDLKPQYTQ